MGGGGLLIFYVTNVACYKSEKLHFVAFCDTFCRILRQPFPCKSRTFAPNFKAR